jgi:hypothetical protein
MACCIVPPSAVAIVGNRHWEHTRERAASDQHQGCLPRLCLHALQLLRGEQVGRLGASGVRRLHECVGRLRARVNGFGRHSGGLV